MDTNETAGTTTKTTVEGPGVEVMRNAGSETTGAVATVEAAPSGAAGPGAAGGPQRQRDITDEEIQETYGLSRLQYKILLQTVCKGAPREMAAFFLSVCKVRGLDPLQRQIYLWPDKTIKDGPKKGEPEPGCTWSIVAGIDGMRAIAARNPLYRGQSKPVWEFEVDEEQPDKIARFKSEDSQYGHVKGKRKPTQCEITVYRAIGQDPTDKDLYIPFYGICRFDEYAKRYSGKLQGNWENQPENQIAVRTEAQALRKGFPEDVGGFYTPEEMSDRRDDTPALPSVAGEATAPQDEFRPPEADEIEVLAKQLRWPVAVVQGRLKANGGDYAALLAEMQTKAGYVRGAGSRPSEEPVQEATFHEETPDDTGERAAAETPAPAAAVEPTAPVNTSKKPCKMCKAKPGEPHAPNCAIPEEEELPLQP